MIHQVYCLLVGNSPLTTKLRAEIQQVSVAFTSIACVPCERLSNLTKMVKKHHPSLIFIDAAAEGFDTFVVSTDLYKTLEVIVVSENPQDAHRAYELGAIDFLLTTYTPKRLEKAILRGLNVNLGEHGVVFPEKLLIRAGRRIEVLNPPDVVYIEAYGTYSKFYLEGGKVLLVNGLIKQIEQQLPPSDFIRLHRSYIVNKAKITSFDYQKIYIGDKDIEVGTTYAAKFKSYFEVSH
jgi:DNA-binding LytR/AlgR family response regulator